MRLGDFIMANLEPILMEWEIFARNIWPGSESDPLILRDHAWHILSATASDMQSAQSTSQQTEKRKGDGVSGKSSDRLDRASGIHAIDRVKSGFDLQMLVAEYRALRGSVIGLWRKSKPIPDEHDLAELTRFNESIDQSLTEAVRCHTAEVEDARQMFLAILGHDLRNPLTSIRTLSYLLMKKPLDVESIEMAAGISSSAHSMAKMVTDLLVFTGAKLGRDMPIEAVEMDLETVCNEVVAETQALCPKLPIDFQTDGDLKGVWDPDRLRQVVANLLGNAVQHGTAAGHITLDARVDGNDVVLSVHNRGMAIEKTDIPTIFDPLVRKIQDAVPRQSGSIGLGLYIAREIVHAHGGAIAVTSTLEDGTTFTVHLPRKWRS